VPDLPNGQYVVAYTGPTAWARREIEINGRSPEPVTLELQKPITVSGKVEFAGTAALPAVSNTPTARPLLYAELAPTQMITGTILLPRPIQANAFSTQGSGPGPFMLRAGAPAPWIQVSGLVNGIDTLDLPLPANASFEDALIVFADRPNLLVNVKDANGSPVTNATVAVFTEDVRYWGTRSRRAQLMAVTPVGTATFSGLPPAKYLVAAVTDVPANRVVSASLLATLKPLALPVEIAIGESRSINLTIK
jgi:hypothetical protein